VAVTYEYSYRPINRTKNSELLNCSGNLIDSKLVPSNLWAKDELSIPSPGITEGTEGNDIIDSFFFLPCIIINSK
jgi:hypothetical protein